MKKSYETYQSKSLKTNYVSVVVSISLVLFLIGILGCILIKTKDLSNYFKEKVVLTVFLKDSSKTEEKKAFIAELEKKAYVKDAVFISKKDAAKTYSKEIGEDFVTFLGRNPLKDAIDIYLNSDFVESEKAAKIVAELEKKEAVYEVTYDKTILQFLTKNIKRISFWLLLFSGIFTLISIILINNSIKLSIYAKRFDIKTMQMVGATKKFIRKPFIIKSIQLGVIGAIIAIIAILFLLIYVNQLLPDAGIFSNYIELVILAGIIIGLGIFISWISTFFATQRLLNVRTEKLY